MNRSPLWYVYFFCIIRHNDSPIQRRTWDMHIHTCLGKWPPNFQFQRPLCEPLLNSNTVPTLVTWTGLSVPLPPRWAARYQYSAVILYLSCSVSHRYLVRLFFFLSNMCVRSLLFCCIFRQYHCKINELYNNVFSYRIVQYIDYLCVWLSLPAMAHRIVKI